MKLFYAFAGYNYHIYLIGYDWIEDVATQWLVIELRFCFYKDGAATLLLTSTNFLIHHIFGLKRFKA